MIFKFIHQHYWLLKRRCDSSEFYSFFFSRNTFPFSFLVGSFVLFKGCFQGRLCYSKVASKDKMIETGKFPASGTSTSPNMLPCSSVSRGPNTTITDTPTLPPIQPSVLPMPQYHYPYLHHLSQYIGIGDPLARSYLGSSDSLQQYIASEQLRFYLSQTDAIRQYSAASEDPLKVLLDPLKPYPYDHALRTLSSEKGSHINSHSGLPPQRNSSVFSIENLLSKPPQSGGHRFSNTFPSFSRSHFDLIGKHDTISPAKKNKTKISNINNLFVALYYIRNIYLRFIEKKNFAIHKQK